MKIKLTSIHVDDQDKALRFYTDVLGFVKKADFTQGPFRWLTVASPEEPDGAELQLAPNGDPTAKAYQQAKFDQGQPAAMFYVDNVEREYERQRGHGDGRPLGKPARQESDQAAQRRQQPESGQHQANASRTIRMAAATSVPPRKTST